MSVYADLAKEITDNNNISNNVIGIGTINNLEPMSIFLTDITLDQDDLIISDKIKKLITPLLPDITGDCQLVRDNYDNDKLKVGDKVLLYGISDGQKFVVIDRVYP